MLMQIGITRKPSGYFYHFYLIYVNTFGIYLGIYQFASQFGIYLGIYPGKYPGKYPECIYLKVFTFSLLANMRNDAKFEKIRTKMGNNPVGKR